MRGRRESLRSARSGAAKWALKLMLLSCAIPFAANAGILRDVMEKVGLSKAPPAPVAGAPMGSQTLPRQGYACCNFHFSRDWINDGNYAELPMLPVGTPVEVLSYGSNRAYVKIDGKPMRLGHDYGRSQESLEAWVGKVVVNDNPRVRISGYPRAIQAAIHDGKVMVGMSREQAIVSVGYPLTSENPTLDASTWRMWRSSRGEYQLNFGADGRVATITGDPSVTSLVVYQPAR